MCRYYIDTDVEFRSIKFNYNIIFFSERVIVKALRIFNIEVIEIDAVFNNTLYRCDFKLLLT